MKKVAVLSSLLFALLSTSAFAGWRHEFYPSYGHYNGWNWVGPAFVGGLIGYELSRPQPVYTPPPTVIYQSPPPPIVVRETVQTQRLSAPSCTPWTETQHPDGSITRTRTCTD
jgi:hypothetical protein